MNKTLPELPFFGSRIEIYRKINSTQARAREIYRESPRISLVASFAQGEGYGRRGSKWVSPPGGLYFSILMKTDCPRAPVPARVALYALKALEKSGRKALWKWPNDIIYKDKKVGGILIESPGKNWIIIGLGLNAFSDINVIPPRLRSRAGLLDLDKKAFLSDFLLNLKKHFPSENLSAGEKEYLNSRLSIKGLYCRVEQKEGIVEGLDKKGALRLQGSEEEYSFFSGSPTLVDRSLFPSRPLVLVDAGNTFTRIGLFKGGVIEKSLNIKTKKENSKDYINSIKREIRKMSKDIKIEGAAFSCVVKNMESEIKKALAQVTGISPLAVNHNCQIGLSLKVKKASQVGPDRICNASAAYNIYRGACVVVDLGTANTFDVVSKKGEYLGGVIAPGADSMASALFKKADRLDRVDFDSPEKVIGDSTAAALKSGFYLTISGQIEKILEGIAAEMTSDFKLIFTGGSSGLLPPRLVEKAVVDPDLTLKGLALILGLTK